jgi:hypothetical protein
VTKQEYADYEASVKDFFDREGIQNLSGKGETYFSWRSCECCGTTLGGDREDANGYNPTTKEVQEYSVCTDCIYYAEYGRLDDMTMLEVEKDNA